MDNTDLPTSDSIQGNGITSTFFCSIITTEYFINDKITVLFDDCSQQEKNIIVHSFIFIFIYKMLLIKKKTNKQTEENAKKVINNDKNLSFSLPPHLIRFVFHIFFFLPIVPFEVCWAYFFLLVFYISNSMSFRD